MSHRGRCFVCGKRRQVEVYEEDINEDGLDVVEFTALCREHRPQWAIDKAAADG